jgi:multidrug efflux pump subunit AcrA (membrane-fusion protein)
MFRRVISWFVFCAALVFSAQMQAVASAADDHHDDPDDYALPQLYPAIIVIDPRQVVSVVVKINARLRNLRSLYVGQRVARDQVLGELESAELETVQRTYLGLIANLDAVQAFSMTVNEKLIDARMNLAWRGMSEADIKQLDETKEPLKLIALKAPVAGYLYSLNVVNEQIVNAGGQSGVYTTTGTTVATIAKPEAVYVEAQMPLKDAAGIKPGAGAEVLMPTSDGAHMTVKAKVERIFSFVNPVTQRKRVRLLLAQHPERLPLAEGLPVMVQFKGNAHAP